MARKMLSVLLVIGAAIFLVAIYLPSYTQYQDLKRKDENLAAEIERLKTMNTDLQEEIVLLQTDVKYLEKVLREDIGLVKPGEVIYKFVKHQDIQDMSPSTSDNVSELVE